MIIWIYRKKTEYYFCTRISGYRNRNNNFNNKILEYLLRRTYDLLQQRFIWDISVDVSALLSLFVKYKKKLQQKEEDNLPDVRDKRPIFAVIYIVMQVSCNWMRMIHHSHKEKRVYLPNTQYSSFLLYVYLVWCTHTCCWMQDIIITQMWYKKIVNWWLD